MQMRHIATSNLHVVFVNFKNASLLFRDCLPIATNEIIFILVDFQFCNKNIKIRNLEAVLFHHQLFLIKNTQYWYYLTSFAGKYTICGTFEVFSTTYENMLFPLMADSQFMKTLDYF